MNNLKMKFRRIELNISQTELAQRAGVTRQTIGLIVLILLILGSVIGVVTISDHLEKKKARARREKARQKSQTKNVDPQNEKENKKCEEEKYF